MLSLSISVSFAIVVHMLQRKCERTVIDSSYFESESTRYSNDSSSFHKKFWFSAATSWSHINKTITLQFKIRFSISPYSKYINFTLCLCCTYWNVHLYTICWGWCFWIAAHIIYCNEKCLFFVYRFPLGTTKKQMIIIISTLDLPVLNLYSPNVNKFNWWWRIMFDNRLRWM